MSGWGNLGSADCPVWPVEGIGLNVIQTSKTGPSRIQRGLDHGACPPAAQTFIRGAAPRPAVREADNLRILLINPTTTDTVTALVADHARAIAGDAVTFVLVTGRFGAHSVQRLQKMPNSEVRSTYDWKRRH